MFIFDAIAALFPEAETIKKYIKALFGLFASVAGLLGTLGAMLWPFVGSAEGLDNVADKLDATAGILASMPVGPWMDMLNRIFPVTEAFALLGVLWLIQIAAVLLRWVRSFIPTIGG